MKVIDQITKAEFSWFDLVFILIVFTAVRNVPAVPQSAIFVAAGAVVGWEHVWLRRMIDRRKLREMAAKRRAA